MKWIEKPQMLATLCACTLLTSAPQAQAEGITPYRIKVVRDSKTHYQLAMNMWQGEWPSPIIDINAHQNGRTIISGYISLRDKAKRQQCSVQNGLYHPWSDTPNSVLDFYVITGIESYRVKRTPAKSIIDEFELPKGRTLRVGDQIANAVYLAEGGMMAQLKSKGYQDIAIEWRGNVLDEYPQYFTQTEFSDPSFQSEQWLYLQCENGDKVFVQDIDLLKQKGVGVGEFDTYGKIKIAANPQRNTS